MHNIIKQSWAQQTKQAEAADNFCTKLRQIRKVLPRWEMRYFKAQAVFEDEYIKEIKASEREEKV